jgi:hypothetical protein
MMQINKAICVNNVTRNQTYVTLFSIRRYMFAIHLKRNLMPLLTILIVLIAAGVLLWVVNTYIPMDRKIKYILNVVVVIIVIVWLLKIFGVFSYLSNVHI